MPSSRDDLVRHYQQFDVRLRFARADNLGVDLVELAVAALLRAFVAEQRAVRRQLERCVLLPAIGEVGARDPGGEFGRRVSDSPPRSSKLYISLETTSVVSPKLRLNTVVFSNTGISARRKR